nr:MAG TPA: hypothetical protein [Bacteriophage sp.]
MEQQPSSRRQLISCCISCCILSKNGRFFEQNP